MAAPQLTAAHQLDPASVTLIQSQGQPALLIATGAGHLDVPDAVAAVLAATYPEHQVEVLVADGSRWSSAELGTEIAARVQYAPDTHRHLIIADAHRAAPTAHDRLLKLLEDAAQGTTIWLTHPAGDTLPSALRGRAGAHVSLRSASTDHLVDLLTAETTMDARQARDLLRLADGNVVMAALAHKFDMRDQLAAYAAGRTTGTPTVAATRLTLALAHLAVAHHHRTAKAPVAPTSRKGDGTTADLTRLTPAAKATLRRLCATVLARWRRDIADELGAAPLARARDLCVQHEELGTVAGMSTYGTPVTTLLAAAYVAGNSTARGLSA